MWTHLFVKLLHFEAEDGDGEGGLGGGLSANGYERLTEVCYSRCLRTVHARKKWEQYEMSGEKRKMSSWRSARKLQAIRRNVVSRVKHGARGHVGFMIMSISINIHMCEPHKWRVCT